MIVFENEDFTDIIEKLDVVQELAQELKDNYDGLTPATIKAKIDFICHELDGAVYRLTHGGEK